MSTGRFEMCSGDAAILVPVVPTSSIGNIIICVPPFFVCSFFISPFWFRLFFFSFDFGVVSCNTVGSTTNQRARRW